MIILDFDGVLFDDERFKRAYWDLFRKHGISRRVHQEAYRESKVLHRGGYRHDLHLALIRKKTGVFNILAAEKDIGILLESSSKYIYPEAMLFIKYWRSKREPLSIISSGNSFQKRKVRSSGITEFFRRVIVADTADKVDPVRGLSRAKKGRIFFIDDKSVFTDAVKTNFPHIFVIQIRRRKERGKSEISDAIVRNLAEARRVIEREIARQSRDPRAN